jgi:hypothetical protein
MNSIQAGASEISIQLVEDPKRHTLDVLILDDGSGMTTSTMDASRQAPLTGARGHGLPRWRDAAMATGGSMTIQSTPEQGTTIIAHFITNHPCMLPMGQMEDTILALLLADPPVRIRYEYQAKDAAISLDSTDCPVEHPIQPATLSYLKHWITEQLKQGTTTIHKEESQ